MGIDERTGHNQHKELTMNNNKKWIWQNKNYPNFSFDIHNFNDLLQLVEKNNNKLNNIIIHNSIDLKEFEINSLTNEIINSAYIEGEILKRESVRNSLKKRLDEKFDSLIDTKSTVQSDNYVSILLDTNLNKNSLSIERLHGWHNCLFESGYSGLFKINVAKFRNDAMQVVSNTIGREKIYYEAPLPQDIDKHIEQFMIFCNNDSINPYIKSAIAHIWFVIIHPYDDGNGRLARAIADFLLPNNNIKLYSISAQINSHKKEYYDILEKTNKFNSNCDITQWINWHLKITNLAIENGINEINNLIFKTNFWDKFRNIDLNQNQQKVLNKILDIGIKDFKGNLSVRKYSAITKTNKATAQKEIDELIEYGCLIKKDNKNFEINNKIFTALSIDEKITQIDNAKSQLESEPHISSHDKVKQFNEQIDDDKNSEADSYKPRKP